MIDATLGGSRSLTLPNISLVITSKQSRWLTEDSKSKWEGGGLNTPTKEPTSFWSSHIRLKQRLAGNHWTQRWFDLFVPPETWRDGGLFGVGEVIDFEVRESKLCEEMRLEFVLERAALRLYLGFSIFDFSIKWILRTSWRYGWRYPRIAYENTISLESGSEHFNGRMIHCTSSKKYCLERKMWKLTQVPCHSFPLPVLQFPVRPPWTQCHYVLWA